MTELYGVPILGGGSGTGTGHLRRQKLGRRAARLTVVTDLGSTEAVKQAVRHGLGISLVLAGTVFRGTALPDSRRHPGDRTVVA